MKYAQTHKPAFLLDFSKLNKNTQKRVVNAAKELEQCPNKPRGDTIKKLRMHNRLWRYRLGDHRLRECSGTVFRLLLVQKPFPLFGSGQRMQILLLINGKLQN